MQKPAETFDHARRHVKELTGRQREVLNLIAEGRTNAEIGERLGISLDGAKWHVSELLSKLGLATREEAAAFQRSRAGKGGWRWLGAGFGLPPLKVGLAASVAAAGLAGGAVLLFQPGNAQVEEPGQPYAMESVVTEIGPLATSLEVWRTWHTGEGDVRVERNYLPEAEGEPLVELSRDGELITVLRGGDILNNHMVIRLPSALPNLATPGPTNARDLDELVSILASLAANVTLSGESTTILGRPTVVLEWRDFGLRMSPTGWQPVTLRAWLDPERMFVMRVELVGPGVSTRHEVTSLEYGSEPAASLFP